MPGCATNQTLRTLRTLPSHQIACTRPFAAGLCTLPTATLPRRTGEVFIPVLHVQQFNRQHPALVSAPQPAQQLLLSSPSRRVQARSVAASAATSPNAMATAWPTTSPHHARHCQPHCARPSRASSLLARTLPLRPLQLPVPHHPARHCVAGAGVGGSHRQLGAAEAQLCLRGWCR